LASPRCLVERPVLLTMEFDDVRLVVDALLLVVPLAFIASTAWALAQVWMAPGPEAQLRDLASQILDAASSQHTFEAASTARQRPSPRTTQKQALRQSFRRFSARTIMTSGSPCSVAPPSQPAPLRIWSSRPERITPRVGRDVRPRAGRQGGKTRRNRRRPYRPRPNGHRTREAAQSRQPPPLGGRPWEGAPRSARWSGRSKRRLETRVSAGYIGYANEPLVLQFPTAWDQ
jgi:hypothetical protein